jgi:signal transduction histidine kinase
LVRNAISYTASGKIHVHTFQQQNRVCIQVRDTGIGIASADLPYIFQRFYRGSNVSQSTIPGSGLGLSLVYEVAKLHQGGLEVDSHLSQGSTFCLWLPACAVERSRAVVAC